MAQNTISANRRLLNGRYVIPLRNCQKDCVSQTRRCRARIPDHFQRMFHYGHRQMRSVVDQSRNIILGHFRQLLLEDAFQPGEDDEAVARTIIIHHPEFDLASALLKYGGL